MALPGPRWPQKLFDQSGRRLLRYLATRLRDGTDADDLAQEAYLRLLRVDEALVVRDARSYALRVATNVATEWGRLSRHRREHVGTDFLDEQESERLGPMEQATNAQQLAAVKRVLESMTPMRRAVVLLHIRDGLTYPQIAAQVGLSVSMVGKHLSLGLEACRGSLK
jgi:RNA polymerase sigma factor (sigma-70 family)